MKNELEACGSASSSENHVTRFKAGPWRSSFCILALSFPFCAFAAAAEVDLKSPEEMEYEVKAAFIYNFMKFIQWPAQKEIKEGQNDTPIQIAIIGNNPFKKSFQHILDKNVQGRAIHLVEMESFEQFKKSYPNKQAALASYQQAYMPALAQCHLAFICESESNSLRDLLGLTNGQALVTVSDLPDFAATSGMIGFVMEKKKVRFEVNLDVAQKETIKISSQLLGLARRVYKTGATH
ncbi:MAG: YfiR family protein [Planctomycetaceae bacterium]|nr:YfiR family protein [Planctomycetaceae bacterium]